MTSSPCGVQESVTSEWDLYHDYTTTQLGLHELLREWRAEMDAYSREPGRYRSAHHRRPLAHFTVVHVAEWNKLY